MTEISVIVPVYNGEKYIKRCYESLLKQQFTDFEIIFIDDGSKDNSLAILNEIAKQNKKIKVIAQKNKKQGGARNTGVDAAIGNYVSFVDVDDFVSEDFLITLYKTIKKYNCDIALSSVIRCKPNGKKNPILTYNEEKVYTNNREKSKAANGNGTGRGVWNKLYKKSFLIKNNLKFRENVSYEDCDYCAKAIYYANFIVTCPHGAYYYCVNPKSTMRSQLSRKKQFDKYTGIKLSCLFELEHGLADGALTVQKFDYRLFGMNLLRIKERLEKNSAYEEFWLFDFIKIYQKKLS